MNRSIVSLRIPRLGQSSGSTVLSPSRLFHSIAPRSDHGENSRLLRDEDIRARRVRLVNPENDTLMPGPFETRELLRSIDRSRYYLLQVSEGGQKYTPKAQATELEDGEEGEREGETDAAAEGEEQSTRQLPHQQGNRNAGPPIRKAQNMLTLDELPVVKLIDKQAALQAELARRKAKKEAKDTGDRRLSKSQANMAKEISFTWGTTLHDISHKLQSIRTNMIRRGAGCTCQVTIANRKGQRVPMDDRMALAQRVEDFLCDWSEAAPAEGLTPSALPYFPRRRGDALWHPKGLSVVFTVEVARR